MIFSVWNEGVHTLSNRAPNKYEYLYIHKWSTDIILYR